LAFIADAAWFDARRARNYPRVIAISYLPVFIWGYWALVLHGSQSDFAAFWAAGRLAWKDPLLAWNFQAVQSLETWFPPGRWVPFVNPPPFLMIVAPFGLLPFGVAQLAWVAATLAAYLLATRRLISRWTALAFAPVLLNAIGGQNGLLTAALLVSAVRLLEKRPFIAGLLLGALLVKPHLGILVPFALVAGRHWRAIAGAGASSIALVGVSLGLFGVGSWQAALAASRLSQGLLLSGLHAVKMQTVFSLLLALGGGRLLASAGQLAVTVAVGALVMHVWRRPRVDAIAKGAVLIAATPLASPYFYGYDLAMMILPVAWLVRQGSEEAFVRWERPAIGLTFLWPLVSEPLAHLVGFNLGPLASTALVLILVRRLRAPPVSGLCRESARAAELIVGPAPAGTPAAASDGSSRS
jgi:hypothetical protein